MKVRTEVSADGAVTSAIVDILRTDVESVSSETEFRGMMKRIMFALEARAADLFWAELEPKIRAYIQKSLTDEEVHRMIGSVIRDRFLTTLYRSGGGQ